ncbi:MAG: hypothetical protein FJY55_01250, partial [Betaproteobacteria bacterium]|nr:hypothetical protein [Betaproteobacteria bacterium]
MPDLGSCTSCCRSRRWNCMSRHSCGRPSRRNSCCSESAHDAGHGVLKKLFVRRSPAPPMQQPDEAGAIAARVDALYAEAAQAWQRDDHAQAAAQAAAALALDDTLPVLHYLRGCALLALGESGAAADSLERCLALRPAYPLVLNAETQAALARARADLARGNLARSEPRHAGPPRMISVIINSVTPDKFACVSANYRRLLGSVPHEIIGIHDARSMCEGYNRGVRQAGGELLVFSHDDIEIRAPDFADRLQNRLKQFALIGVAGTTQLAGRGWAYARWPHIHGQVGMPPEAGAGIAVTAFHMRGPATPGAQALDGLFLACRREAALALPFDEATFDGWHLYDFDFSFRAWQAGMATAVCHDFLVVHASKG